jgi:hypothetical protein
MENSIPANAITPRLIAQTFIVISKADVFMVGLF